MMSCFRKRCLLWFQVQAAALQQVRSVELAQRLAHGEQVASREAAAHKVGRCKLTPGFR